MLSSFSIQPYYQHMPKIWKSISQAIYCLILLALYNSSSLENITLLYPEPGTCLIGNLLFDIVAFI